MKKRIARIHNFKNIEELPTLDSIEGFRKKHKKHKNLKKHKKHKKHKQLKKSKPQEIKCPSLFPINMKKASWWKQCFVVFFRRWSCDVKQFIHGFVTMCSDGNTVKDEETLHSMSQDLAMIRDALFFSFVLFYSIRCDSHYPFAEKTIQGGGLPKGLLKAFDPKALKGLDTKRLNLKGNHINLDVANISETPELELPGVPGLPGLSKLHEMSGVTMPQLPMAMDDIGTLLEKPSPLSLLQYGFLGIIWQAVKFPCSVFHYFFHELYPYVTSYIGIEKYPKIEYLFLFLLVFAMINNGALKLLENLAVHCFARKANHIVYGITVLGIFFSLIALIQIKLFVLYKIVYLVVLLVAIGFAFFLAPITQLVFVCYMIFFFYLASMYLVYKRLGDNAFDDYINTPTTETTQYISFFNATIGQMLYDGLWWILCILFFVYHLIHTTLESSTLKTVFYSVSTFGIMVSLACLYFIYRKPFQETSKTD